MKAMDTFKKCDSDKDGDIDMKEFENCLAKSGFKGYKLRLAIKLGARYAKTPKVFKSSRREHRMLKAYLMSRLRAHIAAHSELT